MNYSINSLNPLMALYFFSMNLIDIGIEYFINYTKYVNQKIRREDGSFQTNSIAFWITVLIALILVGLTTAGLMWACKKFGNGGYFKGKFKVLGSEVMIQCGK